MTKIIALVDGSTYSTSVCDLAVWAAKHAPLDICVAHVMGHRQGVKQDLSGNIGLGARTALLEELAELDAAKAKLAQKHGRAILEDAQSRIQSNGIETVTTTLRSGDLLESIAELEDEDDLVVIGKRGEAADYAKLHLGSNFERVTRSTKGHVLVASQTVKPISKVLVAYDGQAAAMRAVDYIARTPMFQDLDIEVVAPLAESVEASRKLEGALALLRGAGLSAEGAIVSGPAEEAIAREVEARGADMVVKGTYAHSRLRGMILGSKTSEIVASCHVPILLIR